MTPFTHRLAKLSDLDDITLLMEAAISELQKGFLTDAEIEASRETMGLDTSLIEDDTYFVILHDETIVGCGGWGKRATLYGGSHSTGRSDRLLDPTSEPARIRAMYTHPDWTRKSVGSYIIKLAENAAREAGFSTMTMGATLSGRPLYEKCGYRVIEEIMRETSKGVILPLLIMMKEI